MSVTPSTQAHCDAQIDEAQRKVDALLAQIQTLKVQRNAGAGAEIMRSGLLAKVSWTLDEDEPGLGLEPWIDEREEQTAVLKMVSILNGTAYRGVGLAPGITLRQGESVVLKAQTLEHLKAFQKEHNLTLVPAARARHRIAQAQKEIRRWSMFLGDDEG